MCDHHADALLPKLDRSAKNIASGAAALTGRSVCACRFGALEVPDSKPVN
tara:strand:- start:21445 stop:21594 length:150 start_codon:yes stop_codon:yes gene_type:complete